VNHDKNTRVAVFDIGKTNVKLTVATREGGILETISAPNATRAGPPYRHHDLAGLEDWLMEGLRTLAAHHDLGAFVACGHGSGGVLVAEDGPAAPMIDYEQPLPDEVERAYANLAGSYLERGSPIMVGATHLARQLLWLEREYPEAFGRARWFLGLPQYWAWRLSGGAVSEFTILGAQSHLWNVPERRVTEIARSQAWNSLMPPLAPAWAPVGRLRPELAKRFDLPADMDVLAGIHDSSANFYRYQAAGHANMTVVSTGTWIVGLSDVFDQSRLSEARGMTCNADVEGRPLAGALTMGGREFSRVAGEDGAAAVTDAATVARLIERGTMALPSFGDEDGMFPGSAGTGAIIGPPPANPSEKRALAVLYTALLTTVCLDALRADGLVVLDGSFVRDPLYAGLVAASRQASGAGAQTLFNLDSQGTAAGSALLADHVRRTGPVAVTLKKPPRLDLPGLAPYRARWLERARDAAGSPAAMTTMTRMEMR
jgi:sugar (pentulose or hexulose) kinase